MPAAPTVQTVGWTTVYPIGSIDFVEFCKMKISCILRFDQYAGRKSGFSKIELIGSSRREAGS